jgi:hypothetical protein
MPRLVNIAGIAGFVDVRDKHDPTVALPSQEISFYREGLNVTALTHASHIRS